MTRAVLKDYLEGMSHILFFKNYLFALGFLTLSLAFSPHQFACGLLASLMGFVHSKNYRTAKVLQQTGLISLNGFFFGIALSSLFQASAAFYLCLVLGAAAIPLVTKAAYEVLQHWKLSPLIFPYILAVWVLWLCSYNLNLDPVFKALPQDSPLLSMFFTETHFAVKFINAIFYSVGQIFFVQNANYGLGLLLLVFAFNQRFGFYFLTGTAVATLVFFLVSKHNVVWEFGYLSYSAGLIGIAMASMKENFSFKTIMLFCVLSVFLTLALDHFLSPMNLPLLSLPYVVTFWLAILSRAPRLNVSWAPVSAEARR